VNSIAHNNILRYGETLYVEGSKNPQTRVRELRSAGPTFLSLTKPLASITTMKPLVILFALSIANAVAVEPWADSRLTVTNGVELWLDASREPAARQARKLAAPINGKPIDFWHDASGHARHLNQRALEARPQWRRMSGSGLMHFDGQNDFFAAAIPRESLAEFTVVALVSAHANPGYFRGFLSCNGLGKSDFQSGLNIDLGGAASTNWNKINVEGGGMGGERDLLNSTFDLGTYHLLSVVCGANEATLRVDGEAQGKRERKRGDIVIDEITVGARQIDMQGSSMPYAQSFWQGDVAELIAYNRALTQAELQQVEDYFTSKHTGLLRRVSDPGAPTEVPLVAVPNPPPVQVLVPGFAAREMPLKLKNLNNLVYAPDGRLFAFGYNGNVYQLFDTDGDGIEDKSSVFFDNSQGELPATIGMAWGPGGLYIPVKGRIVRLRDTGKGYGELETAFSDWKPPARFGGTAIDALGIVVDKDGTMYFGLCADDWTSAYRPDDKGKSQYRRESERGSIVKVTPDGKKEVLCSGLRFTVDVAINQHGDVFCTEQEGATWLPNGNPLDELLHIQKGRHYGFPPRHPKHLPDVIDEPSTFDYAPQHQSTCGLHFNDPGASGKWFGPDWWKHDAFVAGESRGKIWRTKLVKTPAGYVAQNQLIASLGMLAVDLVVNPRGDLLVACHSGAPDWGTGPNGDGKLFHISYRDTNAPQPTLAWNASPSELRVTFDRPLDPMQLRNLAAQTKITKGKYASAGDRFETLRPGYRVVQDELATPRYEIPVLSASLTPDRRTLALATSPRESAVNYAVALPGLGRATPKDNELPQHAAIDLLTDLTGVEAEWKSSATNWSGWLPHLDLQVARELTAHNSDHAAFWKGTTQPGALKLRAQLDLWQALRAATQPGTQLDYEYPPETVTVVFKSTGDLKLTASNAKRVSNGESHVTVETAKNKWLPIDVVLSRPALEVSWHTAEDPRPRALQLRRILLPWAKPYDADSFETTPREIKEIAGGNWQRGRDIFFSDQAACHKCHTVRNEGGKLAPDLSNLVYRDYASVMKDITQPSAAINPDAVSYNVYLKDGDVITGVPLKETAAEMIFGDVNGQPLTIKRDRIAETKASTVSLMPEGLLQAMSEQQVKDLMTFLLRQPEPPKQAKR
jgi:putative heme-binding domain-containing protein